MPGRGFAGSPPPPSAEEVALRAALERTVRHLSLTIGERSTRRPEGLEAARDWIEDELRAAGYSPERQTFDAGGVACSNLEAHIGEGAEIAVIGAHYDSAPGTAGADDNATGAAVLLEIARRLRAMSCARTLRFVFFVNEEPPYFASSLMGSRVYAERSASRGEMVVAMLSLESLGYYVHEPGSQRLPFPFSLVYPDRGDFVAFVGNTSSRALVRGLVGAFREHATVPSEGGALPEKTFGVSFSDHASFWRHDVPAVMVTDTALMRNPHYHAPGDLPETLDLDTTARVTSGLAAAIHALACGK